MSYSASRLTLYAILSSIEDDLRALILACLEGEGTPESILGGDIWPKAIERLAKDQGGVERGGSLRELLPYIDFSDGYILLNVHKQALPDRIVKSLGRLTPKLEQLAPIRNRVAHVRPLNFDDLAKGLDTAHELISTADLPWENLKRTLARLEQDPSFVLGLNIPTYDAAFDRHNNLPTPDFDETGFLGREQQVADLTKLCLGPFPIITISGEGGVGKTALALKVGYEFLDSPQSPFDAIVWTTSKTASLTPVEVIRIQGAITDSLGLFQNVAAELAGDAGNRPVDEILEYLAEFRILLILDNLETVLDDRVRDFLQRLPTGSKVLITSRIGLGALEYPYKLPPLDPSDSVQLLRSLASVRGIGDMFKVPNKRLREYCTRMKNNPGWIKWFVSAIQAGRRPEEVLEKPQLFLDFCMSNVYEYLSEEGKRVLRSMLSIPGSHSQAELAFLNDMDAVTVQRSLQLLLTTNFVVMTTVPVGSSFETHYGMSELGRAFLTKNHPTTPKENTDFTKRRRLIVAAGEQIKAEQKSNPFSYGSITTRSPSDKIVARYLLDALQQSKRGDIEKANKSIETAKSLAPGYFEVHRVEALVKVEEQNYPAAKEAYERALDYEPASASLRYWYGNFLLRRSDDVDEALRQFRTGLTLAPNSQEIRLEIARALVYRTEFDEARVILDTLHSQRDSMLEWNRRKLYDLMLTYYQRRADNCEAHHDSISSLGYLESLRSTYETIPPSSLDQKMRYKIAKALATAQSCYNHIAEEDVRSRAFEVLRWITEVMGDEFRDKWGSNRVTVYAQSDMIHGSIARICGGYGFITRDGGGEVFFHRSGLIKLSEWPTLQPGTRVEFCVGSDERARPCALNIKRLGQASSQSARPD